MSRLCVTMLTSFALFLTSWYASNGKGATSPGWWQGAQRLKMIGAMSLLKVKFFPFGVSDTSLASRVDLRNGPEDFGVFCGLCESADAANPIQPRNPAAPNAIGLKKELRNFKTALRSFFVRNKTSDGFRGGDGNCLSA